MRYYYLQLVYCYYLLALLAVVLVRVVAVVTLVILVVAGTLKDAAVACRHSFRSP